MTYVLDIKTGYLKVINLLDIISDSVPRFISKIWI